MQFASKQASQVLNDPEHTQNKTKQAKTIKTIQFQTKTVRNGANTGNKTNMYTTQHKLTKRKKNYKKPLWNVEIMRKRTKSAPK